MYLMDVGDFCSDVAVSNIMYLVGVVVGVIRVAVPIILIVVGMVDLIKALTSQEDKEIKAATKLIVKRVVIAIAVFLVPTVVRLVMNVISQNEYQQCVKCVTNVWSSGCGWKN